MHQLRRGHGQGACRESRSGVGRGRSRPLWFGRAGFRTHHVPAAPARHSGGCPAVVRVVLRRLHHHELQLGRGFDVSEVHLYFGGARYSGGSQCACLCGVHHRDRRGRDGAGHGGSQGPASGQAQLAPVRRLLREAGAAVTVTHTQSVHHGHQVATEAAARGSGDGTVGSLAGAIVAAGGTLGVVPVGRGNDFARQLGISADIAAVAKLLLTGSVRQVDIIDVGGQIVVGSVYAGIDSLTSQLVNRVHRLPARWQYPTAAVWAIATHRSTGYRIVIDGVSQSVDAHTVTWRTRVTTVRACTWHRRRSWTMACSTSSSLPQPAVCGF
ncbi:hypothetical protein E3O10_04000 [Cryobacterium luteum]|uniref:DAGKc domain-containing protein n=1 Tax=Cryobacterium luteum TaxID=1424661 RepID=A0A5F0DAX7_9MICO|nr:hypothetical protein E3O10_04000 [Cryobacterium luteum]